VLFPLASPNPKGDPPSLVQLRNRHGGPALLMTQDPMPTADLPGDQHLLRDC
jgi:hypothetical protein